MAKLNFEIPDALLKALTACGKTEKIAPKMIDAALPIVADAVRKRVAAHRRTGELEGSIHAYKAKQGKRGGYSGRVGFAGYDKQSKTANAQKAISLEYGTSNQAATPFILPAINDCEDACTNKMQEVYNREVSV